MKKFSNLILTCLALQHLVTSAVDNVNKAVEVDRVNEVRRLKAGVKAGVEPNASKKSKQTKVRRTKTPKTPNTTKTPTKTTKTNKTRAPKASKAPKTKNMKGIAVPPTPAPTVTPTTAAPTVTPTTANLVSGHDILLLKGTVDKAVCDDLEAIDTKLKADFTTNLAGTGTTLVGVKSACYDITQPDRRMLLEDGLKQLFTALAQFITAIDGVSRTDLDNLFSGAAVDSISKISNETTALELSYINPDDPESVEFLKGDQAGFLTLTPTSAPTSTPTGSPSETPSSTPSETPSGNPTVTASMSPSGNPTVTASNIPSKTPSESPSGNPTATASNNPSAFPSVSAAPTPETSSPTESPTSQPTATPTGTPSNTPTKTPSNTPTKTPSNTPTKSPSSNPSGTATVTPSASPTDSPTVTPTASPTSTPQCSFTLVVDAGNETDPLSGLYYDDEKYYVYNELRALITTDTSNLVCVTDPDDEYQFYIPETGTIDYFTLQTWEDGSGCYFIQDKENPEENCYAYSGWTNLTHMDMNLYIENALADVTYTVTTETIEPDYNEHSWYCENWDTSYEDDYLSTSTVTITKEDNSVQSKSVTNTLCDDSYSNTIVIKNCEFV